MGILNVEANINLKDCKSKEIFDLIKDGFYELLTRLNNENITDKKKNKIINFIMEEFKKEYKEHIDILLNTGFIDEDILNKSLNIALDKGLIFYLLKRLQDNHDKEISRLLLEIQDAKNEIFRLNCSSCSNCNHWISEAFSTNKNDLKGFCSLFGICNGDLSHDMSNDFCCNKWQNKE